MPKEEVLKRHLAIFTYDLSKLDKVTKVRFVYVLKGRKGEKGLVLELGGHFLVPGCFLLPIEKSAEIESVFDMWKVTYKKEEVLTR